MFVSYQQFKLSVNR